MRVEGEIGKDEYKIAKKKCDGELKVMEESLTENGGEAEQKDSVDLAMVRSEIDKMLSSDDGKVDKNLLFEFVESVTIEKDNVFYWECGLKTNLPILA